MIRVNAREEGLDLRFSEALITIGRGPGNMLQLSAGCISSVHGQIVKREDGYWFQDLGSTNGSMVITRGAQIVLDGRHQREAKLEKRSQLILGDRRQPVILELEVIETQSRELVPSNTIVASRAFEALDQLSARFLIDPAGVKRLHRALILSQSLQQSRSPAVVAAHVTQTIFDTLPQSSVAGLYYETPRGMLPLVLRRRGFVEPLALPWHRLEPLLTAALEEEATIQIDDAPGVSARFERAMPDLRTVIAAPIRQEESPKGLLLAAGSQPFSQEAMDWLALLASQTGLSLHNLTLHEALEKAQQRLSQENEYLKAQDRVRHGEQVEMVGESDAIRRILRQVSIVARTETTVLIQGETGTGKELVARQIHDESPRAARLFAAVNCGALTETLLESELFGHVKGAFTGATTDKKGLFEVADQGTLFLDEIGEVSPAVQVRLLRVLENGEITPVGAARSKRVDVRVVAATNRNLRDEVAAKRFREDLFYRINVFPVEVPPLRERRGDVLLLARHFLAIFSERFGREDKGFTSSAQEHLERHRWPGNIRELQNEIERAVLLAEGEGAIGIGALSEGLGGRLEMPLSVGPLHDTLAEFELRLLKQALLQHDFNRTQTAKTLKISRQALTAKLNKYKLLSLKRSDFE